MTISFKVKGTNFPIGAMWWRVYWLPAPSYDIAHLLVDGPISKVGIATNLPADGGLQVFVWDIDPTGVSVTPLFSNRPDSFKFVAEDKAIYTYDIQGGQISEPVFERFPWWILAGIGAGLLGIITLAKRKG